MKEAYSRFHGKGFKIVSLTVDDNREEWEMAWAEEDLPWTNVGMGWTKAAPVADNVTGVPVNHLVDSRSGEIVARKLQGHKLDEKLEELFD